MIQSFLDDNWASFRKDEGLTTPGYQTECGWVIPHSGMLASVAALLFTSSEIGWIKIDDSEKVGNRLPKEPEVLNGPLNRRLCWLGLHSILPCLYCGCESILLLTSDKSDPYWLNQKKRAVVFGDGNILGQVSLPERVSLGTYIEPQIPSFLSLHSAVLWDHSPA